MVSLKKIKLNNFLSHKSTEIDFSDEDKILLDGNSGAGKSSIIDAIVWAIYGVGRSENKSLVFKGSEKAIVELVLRSGKEYITLKRSVTAKGKHSLSVTFKKGEKGKETASELTGIKELQSWIEKELIGASYLLFVNSVVHTQEGTELFVTQTAAKRKELLLEIVNADDYEKTYNDAKDKLSQLSNIDTALRTSVLEINNFVSSMEERTSGKEKIDNETREYKTKNIELKKRLNNLEEILDKNKENISGKTTISFELKGEMIKLEQQNNEISKAEVAKINTEKHSNIEQKLLEYNQEEEKLLSSINEQKKLIEIEEENEKKHKELTSNPIFSFDSSSYDWKIKSISEQISESNTKETCPSGIKCPYEMNKQEILLKRVTELTEITKERDEKEKQKKELLDEYNKLPSLGNLHQMRRTLDSLNNDLSGVRENKMYVLVDKADYETNKKIASTLPLLKKEKELIEISINEIKKKLEDVEKKLEEFTSLNVDLTISHLRTEIENNNRYIARNETILESISADEETIKKEKERLKQIEEVEIAENNNKIEKVKLVKEAFGSNGIKSVVIDYMIPKLEKSINDILSKLSEFEVRLDTQTEKSSGDGVKEGLFITIINSQGEELPYESYSGGEKLKITVAISEALASLQKVSFRAFDEMYIGLDSESTESFAMILERLQKDFPQVLCISHLQMIKDLFDKKIKCVKNNGVTTIN